jgi:uncharacterized protein
MTAPEASLMTPAPELEAPPGYEPTGNLQVHLSANRTRDAAIERVGVVHLGVDGVLDLVGPEGGALVTPILSVGGERLLPERVDYLAAWVPVWRFGGAGCRASLTLLAPIGERGVALHVEVASPAPVALEVRLEATPGHLEVVRFRSQPLALALRRTRDPWTGTVVWDNLSPYPLVALAASFEGDWRIDEEGPLGWVARCALGGDGAAEAGATVFLGVAPEGDGARTTALHLRRVGWGTLLERSRAWLTQRRQAAPEGLELLANRNLFFAYFFAQADAIDTGAPVMLTSRSFVYYVSGAFWSRDSLLWALPAVGRVDARRARELLLTAFTRYARHPGDHAQYLSGEILYPGFELDEAAAYPLALARYTLATGDRDLARHPAVEAGLRHVLEVIALQRHGERALYRTFLSPTDDPVGDAPYLAYDNFILAAALRQLGGALDDAALSSWGDDILREATAAFRLAGPAGDVFGFAATERGEVRQGDEPGGSLLLLPSLGVCSADDPVWRATAAWIRSPDNPHHYPGAFPGRGSAHFRHPSVFGLVNDLFSGYLDEPLAVLRSAPLDNGLACESYGAHDGVVTTGGAFATLAGWLADALVSLGSQGEDG